jgi:hypothetical protein
MHERSFGLRRTDLKHDSDEINETYLAGGALLESLILLAIVPGSF